MKIQVIHDDKGQIKSVGAVGRESGPMTGLQPQQGERVSVIWTSDREGIELHQYLASVYNDHRIKMTPKGATLVRTGHELSERKPK